jgi:hypothetical protein
LLSSWGVPFEGVDVEAHPEGKRDLERLKIPRVPATITGDDRFVHGWNPDALAELVGVTVTKAERLPPEELAQRLDRVLDGAQRAIVQFSDAGLDAKAPDRDRTVRQIGWHIVRLSLWFRETREQGGLPDTAYNDADPASIGDAQAIVRFGDTARGKLREYFARPGWCDGSVETYYGRRTAHEFMERTAWHAAQHLRQLYWFLERQGVRPDRPLTDADFAGLPIPREIWS